MFSRVWGFMKRHRRKFYVTTAVVGGGIFLGRYAIRKFQEWEEKEIDQCREMLRRDSHFENTQKTCHQTVLSLVPNLKDGLAVLLDSDGLTSVLQMKPANKIQVWEELKIVAFSRAVGAIYGNSLLVCLLQVQMNVLGGYLFVDAFHCKGTDLETSFQVTQEVQQTFLESVQRLLNEGLKKLIDNVKRSVNEVVGRISLKDKLSLSVVQKIFSDVQASFENDPNNPLHDMSTFLLPLHESESFDRSECLNRIMGETREILDSEDFKSVFGSSINCGFTHLSDWLAGFFGEYGKQINGANFVNPHSVGMPLAKMIPALNNLMYCQCSAESGQLPELLIQLESVKLLAGNIYEAFSQLSNDEDVQNHNTWFSRIFH